MTDPVATPLPAETAAPPGTDGAAAAAVCDQQRLAHLFRVALRDGRVHPLLRLLQVYRQRSPRLGGVPVARDNGGGEPLLPMPLDASRVKAQVAELPHLPQAAMRALQTLRREDASLDEVATDLGCDASMAARVLRLANSPFYGVPGRVSTISGAAQVLGRRTLESVLTLAAVPGQFGPVARSRLFVASAFWRHALASSIVARALARAHGGDEDQAFVAALLHDIGLLAMSVYFPAELDSLLAQARQGDVDLHAVETRQGCTPHAQVGSWIAEHWRFPPSVVHAIACHHHPQAVAGTATLVADCVHVASATAHALDMAHLPHDLVPALHLPAWHRVAVPDDLFLQILADAEAGVEALCGALQL